MKNLLFTALASILSVSFASAQHIIQWQKCLGGTDTDDAFTIQQTNDGGYIVAGYSDSNDGDVSDNRGVEDYWVIKLTSLGTIEWQKSIGGSSDDIAWSVLQTDDGGYIVAGYSESNDGDVSDIQGQEDCWVVKLNSLGIIEWQKSLGGTGAEVSASIKQTFDGGYIFAGFSFSNDGDVSGNHGGFDYWIVKLTNNGSIEWQKSLGGSDGDFAYFIQQTNDAGYIVVGESFSNDGDVSGNHGENDCWVVKLTGLGTIEWQKSLGGSFTERVSSIQQTFDGGYILAGNSESNDGDVSGNHGGYDSWVVKLTSVGTIEWQKSLGGSSYDGAGSIQQTNDGGFIFAGSSASNDGDVSGNHGNADSWLVKLSSIGIIEWQKSLGGTGYEYASDIQQTGDGGFIVSGNSGSNDGDVSGNHGSQDFWVVKITNCQLSLLNQPESQLINVNSDAQFLVSSSDPLATYQWQTDLGAGFQNLNNVSQFSGTVNDTLTISNVTLANNNQPFRCIISSGSCSDTSAVAVLTVGNITGPNEISQSNLFSVYPNPAQHVINVKADAKLLESVYTIYDNTGKVVLSGNINSEYTAIEIGDLSGGIYLFSVGENLKQTFKIIKE